jgi:Cof subfamily protein (haloacid dehalogenase superfamily)
MKIAATDFDGTLYTHEHGVTDSDLSAIQEWRQAGNKFGIVTGRGLKLILLETSRWQIPVDFFVCTNGAAIFDGQQKLLQEHALSSGLMRRFLQLPFLKDGQQPLLIFTDRDAYSYHFQPRVAVKELRPVPQLDLVPEFKAVTQISMEFADQAQTEKAVAEIEHAFSGTLQCNVNRCFVDVNISGTNKYNGLKALQECLDWQDAPLYPIGDDRNDLPMIEGYDGFTVTRAKPFMHEAAQAVYPSVGSMLNDKM